MHRAGSKIEGLKKRLRKTQRFTSLPRIRVFIKAFVSGIESFVLKVIILSEINT